MISRNSIARMAAYFPILVVASLMASAQEERVTSSIPRVKCEELKNLIENKAPDILVVSNDPQESFDEGHVPGAVSFPWTSQLKPPINLPRNKTLILYCSCSHEEDSLDMAAKLAQFGYRNVKVLEGGFLRWSELKFPIAKK